LLISASQSTTLKLAVPKIKLDGAETVEPTIAPILGLYHGEVFLKKTNAPFGSTAG
jgi:hypothetical protein